MQEFTVRVIGAEGTREQIRAALEDAVTALVETVDAAQIVVED